MRTRTLTLLLAALGALPLALRNDAPTAPTTPAEDDPRAATVTDRQGFAFVRAVGRERWAPLGPRDVVMPGDQVRTDARGANAVELRLAKGGGAVLGPGTLAEVIDGTHLRLMAGEAEVKGDVEATGPGGFARKDAAAAVLRAQDGKTVKVDEPPRWLTGYRASTTDEWMGSLLAKVDGREVPLTIGYHKVDVVIRDQIARTTIEESFVNTTATTLEGVFTFPLPADASISGFGMWIGSELVEADIVEKQKARAIYEDILRRKKDPGLLEWSGGNLFKARVFPIPAQGEKRIRIQYTQVLPLHGDRMTYRYALRSELLRAHPVRDLRIALNVDSTMPIRAVASPSHETRLRKTERTAIVEFDAKEYAPDKDFEAVFQLDRGSGLTLVPHRRGGDGYFMLLLAPPDGGAGALQRAMLPEQGRLDLVLMADTSGSMDGPSRKAQAQFLAALLGLLAEKDTFRLMTCDVSTRWLADQPLPVNADNVARALAFVEQRASLGWTDLTQAFAEARQRAGAGSTVIYVGDGIHTAGDGDAAGVAATLRRDLIGCGATFHAVSASASYEQSVLEAIAGAGAGSVRALGDDPARTAFDLLAEAAQPAVRDVKVEFVGLSTARVYPERLPNLPAGAQQAVLGRFLPTADQGGVQRGEVVVTGTLAGKPVRYTAQLALAQDDEGNSFVPRLWARRHLDALLARGSTPELKDEVIAFSEEFGIITPYTSFLVLESDEDRERYGVTRRVRMRDGEAFFAQGRDRARTEILRKQMQVARSYRLELRRRALREIGDLGRSLMAQDERAIYAGIGSAPVGGAIDLNGFGAGTSGALRSAGDRGLDLATGSEDSREYEHSSRLESKDKSRMGEESDLGDVAARGEELERGEKEDFADALAATPAPAQEGMDDFASGKKLAARSRAMRDDEDEGWSEAQSAARGTRSRGGYYRGPADSAWRLQPPSELGFQRFPWLGPTPATPPARPDPAWPADVVALLRAVEQQDAAGRHNSALAVDQRLWSVRPASGEETLVSESSLVLGSGTWHQRNWWHGGLIDESWVADGERAQVHLPVRLGRKRAALPGDALPARHLVGDGFWGDLVDRYRRYRLVSPARIDGSGPVRIELRSTWPAIAGVTMVVDPARKVLLQLVETHDERVTRSAEYGDFTEVAGATWPTSAILRDERGAIVQRRAWVIRALTADDAVKAIAERRRAAADGLFLDAVSPTSEEARRRQEAGKAGIADRLRLLCDAAAIQQWNDAQAHLEAVEKAAAGQPGLAWIRADFLALARRGPELLAHARTMAERIGAGTSAPSLTWELPQLMGIVTNILSAGERRSVLEITKPAFFRTPAARRDPLQLLWRRHLAELASLDGLPEAVDLRRAILAEWPEDVTATRELFLTLAGRGDRDGAQQLLRDTIAVAGRFSGAEIDQLYGAWTDQLWQWRQVRPLLDVLATWTGRAPLQTDPHVRWLTALLLAGREAEADRWIEARFAEPIPGHDDDAGRARLNAAIQTALGTGWNLHLSRLDAARADQLAALARKLIDGPGNAWRLAEPILQDWRFQQRDVARALRVELRRRLADDELQARGDLWRIEAFARHAQLDRRTKEDAELLRRLADATVARWRSGGERDGREHALSAALIFTQQLEDHAGRAALLRERLAGVEPEEQRGVAAQLREALAHVPWTPAVEAELIGLLAALDLPAADPAQRALQAGVDVRRLAAILTASRATAALGPIDALEKLSRDERRLKTRAAQTEARKAVVERFAAAQTTAPEPHRPWLWVERLGLAAELGAEHSLATLGALAGDARELLGTDAVREIPRELLTERTSLVLSYLAVHPKAPPALADETLALFRQRLENKETQAAWRVRLFRLLLALDRPAELETALRGWRDATADEPIYAQALGYLLAETGRVREAAEVLEGLLARKSLGAPAVRHLSDWYLVLGEDERRSRAARASFELLPEHVLGNRAHAENRRVSRQGRGVPAELDPEITLVLQVLLGKASHPQNHVWSVQQLYLTTKDFRVLRCLADGVVGHTPEGVFAFLDSVRSLLENVHEEATCDALANDIENRLATAKADADRRGLWLLASLVERRAGMVLNQPGDHHRRGVERMKSAFALPTTPPERRLHAGWLAALGAVPGADYRAEQVRELRAFHDLEVKGSAERTAVALFLWETLWSHDARDEAIDGLTATLAETRSGDGGVADHALAAVGRLSGWLVDRKRFAEAETLVRGEMDRARKESARMWFARQLPHVWIDCLKHRGRVALGEGTELYRAARSQMIDLLWKDEPDQRQSWSQQLCELHQAAYQKAGHKAALDDLLELARRVLPEVATTMSWGRSNIFSQAGQTAFEMAGPLAGLRLLVERLETEPRWLLRVNEDGWRSFGYSVAQWRRKGRASGELARRVLDIATAELHRDLTACEWRVTSMFHNNNEDFWQEKAGDFATVAARVIEEFPASEERILCAASYLWSGLSRHEQAVDALVGLDARSPLADNARFRLARWQLDLGRAGAAAANLTRLVTRSPLVADYRPILVEALFKDGRSAQAQAQMDETRTVFEAAKAWTESLMVQLAGVAVECRFFACAQVLLAEAIPLHQRTAPRRGVGDGQLAGYYALMARAWSGLGNDDEAVAAAGAAVVAWGESQGERQEALKAFRIVIEGVADLPAFLRRRDADVAKTGADAPLLRRIVGEVFLKRGQVPAAIAQLTLARDLQPDDRTTLDALADALEQAGDPRGACAVLMHARSLMPRDLALAERLARTLERAGDAEGVERTFTDMVERSPDEAESHVKLAQRRESQKRGDEALFQWRQAVRIRSLEPQQWLELARAEIRAGRKDDARKTLDHVLRTTWRPEFEDPRGEASKLMAEIPAVPGR